MRVHHVEKARKAQGTCRRAGCDVTIEAGDSYLWIKFRYGAKQAYCAKHHPKPSEMTQSDKLARLYAAQESLEDAISAVSETEDRADLAAQIEGLAEALDGAASEAREVSDEYHQSADNMESAFSGGSSVIDDINTRADNCEEWADALEQAASDVREIARRAEDESDDTAPDDLLNEATECVSTASGELEL